MDEPPPGLSDALKRFPLAEAIFGRRSRRFPLGGSIPDGPLAYASRHEPMPLSEIEEMLVLAACAGNTGWHFAIPRHGRYSPHLPNYAGAAGGRTFPSAAGFHTSELFFTDDRGVFFMATRDAPSLADGGTEGQRDVAPLLEAHRSRIRGLSEGRLNLPPQEPHLEGHNTWVVNRPGTLLVMPVADVASTTSPTSATTSRTAMRSMTTSAMPASRG